MLLEAEKEVNKKTRSEFLELFTVPRNRRAMQASSLLMFMYVLIPLNLSCTHHPPNDIVLIIWRILHPGSNSAA